MTNGAPRRSRAIDPVRWALAGLLAWSMVPTLDADELARTQEDIRRYNDEIAFLQREERGLLADLDRLRAEQRLRQSQFREVQLRSEQVETSVGEAEVRIAGLGEQRRERIDALTRRLRADYRRGPDAPLRRVVQGLDRQERGRRFVKLLDRLDAGEIQLFRDETLALQREREQLTGLRAELASLDGELTRITTRLEASAAERERALRSIRNDRRRREGALAELEAAAEALRQLAVAGTGSDPAPDMDVRRFRGLLGWPAEGKVLAGFGPRVHPRFGTEVPHPGLDIQGSLGDDIRAVFDGQVRYAAWMRGYGLTAIIDHGNDLLSIYAHAALLRVENGDRVRRGDIIGKIGESGALDGPMLYFELRDGGQPVDPRRWLAKR